ncbi:MAG: hypothetical protein A2622_13570 [Bdellovibrionales bacterium RIFCSPHIGHO2_01_FULL_40_29]|nr:MAG: hypothetical protein A2622_13570 [Bdellovibrionales bacterium RIFCSPHIGHO2_01_FULL_40_29]OFZ34275.1 MAG: hypothetical protein A3D17_04380 [Bdellovibrionales bacterium RIFCSPHIGHO2_02_FULL_40_15]
MKIFLITILLSASSHLYASENSETSSNSVKTLDSKPSKVGTPLDAKKASAALNELFRAYESGNITTAREFLDSKMIGFQKMLDGMTAESNTCKQIRIHLLDTQIQAGPDIVTIQSKWEKRCLQLPNFSPKLYTGHSTFLMQRSGTGWNLSGISGSNPLQNSGAR